MKLHELFEETIDGVDHTNKDVKYFYADKYAGKKFEDGIFSVAQLNLASLNGCPSECTGGFVCSENNLTDLIGGPTEVLYINARQNKLTSLSGAPSIIHRSGTFVFNRLTNLHNIHKEILEAESLIFEENPITGKVLGLLKIRNLKKVVFDNKHVELIISKYLPMGDLLECQQELIDNGLEEFAKL
jgi:hypothetical protein